MLNLKQRRQSLNMTQAQLAKKSGVSQSTIAKIEARKLDPSYSKVQQLEQALHKENEPTAQDYMAKIRVVKTTNTIKYCIQLMHEHNISQLPILEEGRIIGIVTERSVLMHPKAQHANDAKESTPSIISKHTPRKVIIQLLQLEQSILVQEAGKVIGIITASDLL